MPTDKWRSAREQTRERADKETGQRVWNRLLKEFSYDEQMALGGPKIMEALEVRGNMPLNPTAIVTRVMRPENEGRYRKELKELGIDVSGVLPDGKYVRLIVDPASYSAFFDRLEALQPKVTKFLDSLSVDELEAFKHLSRDTEQMALRMRCNAVYVSTGRILARQLERANAPATEASAEEINPNARFYDNSRGKE